MHKYQRTDVLRILRITGQQLVGWEKAGLIAPAESYSFFDLLQLKKVRDLRAKRVRSAVIRASLTAMQQQAAGMENPLLEAGTYSVGTRVAFRHKGATVEPLAGQFLMDFGVENRVIPTTVSRMRMAETAGELFAKAIALEEDPNGQDEAMNLYRRVLEMEPNHAAAHINLGTLHYNRQDYKSAELHYRKAVEVDPRYALGYFDLGNVLDETGRAEEAIRAYRSAIALAPTYADAHYNLALAYEKTRQPRRALSHWRAYVKLDTAGPWSTHARNQIQKILHGDSLRVVYRKK